MVRVKKIVLFLMISVLISCNMKDKALKVEVYETSADGNQLTLVEDFEALDSTAQIIITPEIEFQQIYQANVTYFVRLSLCELKGVFLIISFLE